MQHTLTIKLISLLTFIILHMNLGAQLTINVTSVPENTNSDDDIYIAGNFNNWNPGDTSYILTNDGEGKYHILITPSIGNLQYKFTRGTWTSVEGGSQGQEIANRTLFYSGNQQSIDVKILSWKDKGIGEDTREDNVSILDDNFIIPQLGRTRRIWIYTPLGYDTSDLKYPVLYMQDGQNLFDRNTSFAGEWEIDESLNQLFENGNKGIIVVGIDNGGGHRIDEYSPWVNAQYGGGQGSDYADFIVETLKPYIDSNFRTKSDRLNTGIMGSSLGALISFYIAIEHQDVFSKVGIFSPSFWFSNEVYSHVLNKGKKQNMHFYLLGGELESANLIKDIKKMVTTLKSIGFNDSEIKMVTHADGQHSEWYWKREFKDAYLWLFNKNTLSTSFFLNKNNIKLFPNPFSDKINISNVNELENANLHIYDNKGTLKYSIPIPPNGEILINNLKDGLYICKVIKNNKTILTKKLIHMRKSL